MDENRARGLLSADHETTKFHVRYYLDELSRSKKVNFLLITASTAVIRISCHKRHCSNTKLCWRAEGRARLMFSRDTGVDVS